MLKLLSTELVECIKESLQGGVKIATFRDASGAQWWGVWSQTTNPPKKANTQELHLSIPGSFFLQLYKAI